MGWTDQADDLFTIKHVLPEQSLPPRMPSTVSLRLLFTQYLDINAVPRKSFFALLRHFTTEQMESDKLDEFLIGPYAAVSILTSHLVHVLHVSILVRMTSSSTVQAYAEAFVRCWKSLGALRFLESISLIFSLFCVLGNSQSPARSEYVPCDGTSNPSTFRLLIITHTAPSSSNSTMCSYRQLSH